MDAQPTTRRVEFTGLPSPYAYPDVQRMLGAPVRTPQDRRERATIRRELLRQEQQRQMQGFARVQGRSEVTLGPQHGLIGTYTWGPDVWVVEMPLDDIDRLMAMHEVHALAFTVYPDVVVAR